jgi:hypothetical protein
VKEDILKGVESGIDERDVAKLPKKSTLEEETAAII